MVAPLLETKLHVPRVRRGLVRRPRLVEALRRGSGVKLRLVSAPAGSGKTTLLAEWLAGNDTAATAWLSLDPGDNDSATFWTYLVAALRRVAGPHQTSPQPAPRSRLDPGRPTPHSRSAV